MKSPRWGKVFGELRGRLSVNGELEAVSLGDDMHVVPIALANVIQRHGSGNVCDGRLVVCVDYKTLPAMTGKFIFVMTFGRIRLTVLVSV